MTSPRAWAAASRMVGLRIPITMCHGIRGAGTDGDQYALSEEHFEALVKTAHEVRGSLLPGWGWGRWGG